MKSRLLKWFVGIIGVLIAFYAVLLIPSDSPPVFEPSGKMPFAWNSDDYWSLLENEFNRLRITDCDSLALRMSAGFLGIEKYLIKIENDNLTPDDSVFAQIEDRFFKLAMLVAACPDYLPDYVNLFQPCQNGGQGTIASLGYDRAGNA